MSASDPLFSLSRGSGASDPLFSLSRGRGPECAHHTRFSPSPEGVGHQTRFSLSPVGEGRNVRITPAFLPLPWERAGVRASGYADALTLLLESIEISITDDTISNVPSQSGSVKATPSRSTESSALLSGSAQLRMLAFGPPII